jgi:hypothetical protein
MPGGFSQRSTASRRVTGSEAQSAVAEPSPTRPAGSPLKFELVALPNGHS